MTQTTFCSTCNLLDDTILKDPASIFNKIIKKKIKGCCYQKGLMETPVLHPGLTAGADVGHDASISKKFPWVVRDFRGSLALV